MEHNIEPVGGVLVGLSGDRSLAIEPPCSDEEKRTEGPFSLGSGY